MSGDSTESHFAAKSNPTTVTDSPVTDPGSTVKASLNILKIFKIGRKIVEFTIYLVFQNHLIFVVHL